MSLAIGDRIDIPPGGSSTTNGTTGRAITFATALPDDDYTVTISFEAAQSGQLGDWHIGSKTAAGFTLYNDGATGIAFGWLAQRY